MLTNCLQNVVLVIEDDLMMQELIKNYLSNLNLNIIFANNGHEGLSKYKSLIRTGVKPNMIIVDVNMPIMDGVEVTKKILEIDGHANIFGFTALYGTEKTRELRDAGAKRVIPRTIGFKAFRQIIQDNLKCKEILHQ